MLLIRTDGNSTIGTGHIMRCLSLANALRNVGQDVIFMIADDCSKGIIERYGYQCVVLQTEYDHLEAELPVLLPLLRKFHPRFILLDSYFVTPEYMAEIRREAPLAYVDDLNTFDYPANLVVNYTIYANQFDYPPNKCYLLGPQYAPLRKEFQDIPQRTNFELVRNVLISAGGADPEHVTLECVKYLLDHKEVDNIAYHIVLGAMNQDRAVIERLSKGQGKIVLHRQVSNMCSLMLKCDLAISAGGTTLFELCASGLPTVAYVLTDNQIMNVESFTKAGLMLFAGDIRGDKRFAERLFSQLNTLVGDIRLRQNMSGQMQNMIDGSGAGRLAKEICALL